MSDRGREQLLERTVERERRARKAAEALLEEKSLELYERNEELRALARSLEEQVRERTRELARARDEALDASAAKSRFVTHMSHEIRTPLSAVLSAIDLLQQADLAADAAEYVDLLDSSGSHLARLVGGILDLSRIESGELSLTPEPVHLPGLIDDTTATFALMAREKGLDFDVRYLDDLDHSVEVDATQFRQMISNLVGNAVKFTEDGGVRVAVGADRSAGELRVTFSVVDTGPGVAPELADEIFEAFRQAPARGATPPGGTGLGLAITRHLAEMMGGTVSLVPGRAAGAEFRLELPLRETTEDTKAASQEVATAAVEDLRVLVAEDDPVNRRLAGILLERLGCRSVSFARNGQEAVEACAASEIDLVLMDIQMPVMDGLEAARRIQQFDRRPRIVAVTAGADRQTVEACAAAGIAKVLIKPYRAAGLVDAVSTVAQEPSEDGRQAPSTPPAVGEAGYAQLDQAVFARVGPVLVREVPRRLATLADQVTTADLAGASATAHRLRGALYSFDGALAGQLEAFEAACKDGNAEAATAAFPAIESGLRDLVRQVEMRLGPDADKG